MDKWAVVLLGACLGLPPSTAWAQSTPPVIRRDYDMAKLTAPSALSASALNGRRLFVQRCAICHDRLSSAADPVQTLGPELSRDTLKKLDLAGAQAMVANGSERMPGFQLALTAEQSRQIFDYLSTVEPAAPPASAGAAVTPPAGAAAESSAATQVPSSATVSPAAPSGPTGQANARSNLSGRVRDADGRPLSGASVSVRASGSTITTSVYTDADGVYVFPALYAGAYAVWAQHVGYGTAHAEARIGRPASRDFRLRRAEDYSEQLRGSDWLASLPEGTAAERHMKELVRDNCMECHALSMAMHQRFNEAGWLAILNLMERSTYNGWLGPPVEPRPRIDPGNETGSSSEFIIHRHKQEMAQYLAHFRGPTFSPSSLKPQAPPSGEAARVVVTEYDIPSDVTGALNWANGDDRALGPASGNHTLGGDVHDVMVDDDGNAWITSVVYVNTRTLAKLDPRNGQVTDFKVVGLKGEAEWTHGITKAPDGALWADGDGILIRVEPRTNSMQVYRAPDGLATGPRITTDMDAGGNLWSSTRYGAVRFSPATKRWRLFGNVTLGDGFSYGAVADGEGRGWWTQFDTDRVEMADPSTGRTTEYRMALDERRASVATPEDRDYYDSIGALDWGGTNAVPGAQAPRRLGADKRAHAVWVPNYLGLNLARIDTQTGEITYFPLPVPATPYFVTVDRNHNVWMNALSDDAVFRFNPATQSWTIFSQPSLGCDSRHVSLDEKRGEVWVGCSRSSRVARFQFRSAEQMH